MAERNTVKPITGFRTQAGDAPYDFNALANKPIPKQFTDSASIGDFADAKSFQEKINSINTNNFVPRTTTINGKALTQNITLTASDIGIDSNGNSSDASNITGQVAIKNGGTGADNGKDGLKNLLEAGYMILSDWQYGNSVPPIPETSVERAAMMGRIFFVKVQ